MKNKRILIVCIIGIILISCVIGLLIFRKHLSNTDPTTEPTNNGTGINDNLNNSENEVVDEEEGEPNKDDEMTSTYTLPENYKETVEYARTMEILQMPRSIGFSPSYLFKEDTFEIQPNSLSWFKTSLMVSQLDIDQVTSVEVYNIPDLKLNYIFLNCEDGYILISMYRREVDMELIYKVVDIGSTKKELVQESITTLGGDLIFTYDVDKMFYCILPYSSEVNLMDSDFLLNSLSISSSDVSVNLINNSVSIIVPNSGNYIIEILKDINFDSYNATKMEYSDKIDHNGTTIYFITNKEVISTFNEGIEIEGEIEEGE